MTEDATKWKPGECILCGHSGKVTLTIVNPGARAHFEADEVPVCRYCNGTRAGKVLMNPTAFEPEARNVAMMLVQTAHIQEQRVIRSVIAALKKSDKGEADDGRDGET